MLGTAASDHLLFVLCLVDTQILCLLVHLEVYWELHSIVYMYIRSLVSLSQVTMGIFRQTFEDGGRDSGRALCAESYCLIYLYTHCLCNNDLPHQV